MFAIRSTSFSQLTLRFFAITTNFSCQHHRMLLSIHRGILLAYLMEHCGCIARFIPDTQTVQAVTVRHYLSVFTNSVTKPAHKQVVFSGLCPRTHVRHAKTENYQHETDVTWQEYVLSWTLKMIRVW